jgi:hypothetical protein
MKKNKWKFLHKHIWDIPKHPFLMGGGIDEATEMPIFYFYAEIYEIHCILSKKKGKVVEGSEDCIQFKKYHFNLIYNPEADVDTIGHNW